MIINNTLSEHSSSHVDTLKTIFKLFHVMKILRIYQLSHKGSLHFPRWEIGKSEVKVLFT